MDDDIIVLEHLSSPPKSVKQSEAKEMDRKHLDPVMKYKRKRTAAEKAGRAHERKKDRDCERYLREYYVTVSIKPCGYTVGKLALNVGRPFCEIVQWFDDRTIPEAFDAELSKVYTKIIRIEKNTPGRIELEKMHDELVSGPKTFARFKEEIKKSALNMNLDWRELALWLAEEDNYRDAKKRDLLSMNLEIYARRAEFASNPAYGVTIPALKKPRPFYSVFPMKRIKPVKLSGNEQEMPIEIPPHLLTPKIPVPIAPVPLKPSVVVSNPSFVTPTKDFSVQSILATNLLCEAEASHPSN
ncbi:hypothetical protein CAEBREN_24939 [Caenorhabditis brenneri]|uniref:Uncharacterized protein n=1 Tax=Caenorhabditis brenneri TaxID=135651 RepID=G0MBF1_CAEBE|nr:hypothetical protein CAEBREN_24939 [Caenorhabditis brenneri]